MSYRAKAKSIVQAVTRAEHWKRFEGHTQEVMPFTYASTHALSSEACRGTKIHRRCSYVETAEFAEYQHLVAMRALHGTVRAAVLAGAYERAPTW